MIAPRERIAMSQSETAERKILLSLGKAFPEEKADRNEWLRTLYEVNSAKFISNNGTIWSTGALMIPVSFAAFALPIQAKITSGWAMMLLAFASTWILLTWIVIAENYRAFQNKSVAIMTAIEAHVGLDFGSPKLNDLKHLRWVAGRGAIRKMRWILLFLLILGWLVEFITLQNKLYW
jgi:hypothetical protein